MCSINCLSSGLKEEGLLRVPGNSGRIKVQSQTIPCTKNRTGLLRKAFYPC